MAAPPPLRCATLGESARLSTSQVVLLASLPLWSIERDRLWIKLGESGLGILLLQTLAEFSNVAIRKAGIPIDDIRATIDAWRAVLPVHAAEEGDLTAALDVVKAHRLGFWDAMLWTAAQRVGVRQLVTEDLQDGFVLQDVRFVNPFERANDRLIDEILPP